MTASKVIAALNVAGLFASQAVSAQLWNLSQLGENVTIEYDIRHTKDGVTQSGTFTFSTLGTGSQMTAKIDASLGDASCSSTIPVQNAQSIQMQLMMSCMMMAPVAMAMFAPTWGLLMGASWELGSQMTMGQGSNRMSLEVTEDCRHAGLNGLLARMVSNDTEWTTCADYPTRPFPLAVSFTQPDEEVAVVLTEYSGNE